MAENRELKHELVFFSQYKLGGVQNFYKAIIGSEAGKAFSKRWILTRDRNDPAALPPAPFNVTREMVFEYADQSKADSYYALSQLVPAGPGVIMTNFHFELGMISLYRKNKTVFHVCHDDFFLDVARDYAHIIDVFIAHNYTYFEKLQQLLPSRKQDIYFLPYGIKPSPYVRSGEFSSSLKIIFLARFDRKKGVYDLFAIDELLKKAGVNVQWTLVGDGPEKSEMEKKIAGLTNFTIKTITDNDSLFREISHHDIFILPSYLDGLPVALLETMSAGLLPVISRFNDGIKGIIDDSTGFVIEPGDINEFAKTLILLHNNREVINAKGKLARELVLKDFDIEQRAMGYYKLFEQYRELKKSNWQKYRAHISGSIFNYIKYRVKNKLVTWTQAGRKVSAS